MKVITESELIYNHSDKLHWLDEKEIETAQNEGFIQYLFADNPDYINCDGERLPFITINNIDDSKKIEFVVIPELWEFDNPENEYLIEILGKFGAEDWKNNFEKLDLDNTSGGLLGKSNYVTASTWEQFEAVDGAIAYRGGSGKSYTIWKFTGVINGK